MESLEKLLKETTESMEKIKQYAQDSLHKFHANQVHPDMLQEVKVDHHGIATPLAHIASIAVQDNSTLTIKTWEKSLVPAIGKAILQHNQYGFSTRSDGDVIYAIRSPLTEDARKKIVRLINVKAEECKVKIRNVRKQCMEKIKQFKAEDEVRQGEDDLQKLTDNFIAFITTIQKAKAVEVMKV